MDTKIKAILAGISTATLTTVLLKKGLRNVWLRGALPSSRDRSAGRHGLHLALRAGAGGSGDPGKLGLAHLHPRRDRGDAGRLICVVDAMGVTDAGIFGDILCARMAKRKVAALITDGVVRDIEGVLGDRPAGVVRGRARRRPRWRA